MITGSVAQTVILTIIVFFVTLDLNSILAIGAYGNRLAPTDITSWLHPCGTQVTAALKKLPQRHSVHRVLKRVRTQLRVAQHHFRKDFRDIHEIYSKVRERSRATAIP